MRSEPRFKTHLLVLGGIALAFGAGFSLSTQLGANGASTGQEPSRATERATASSASAQRYRVPVTHTQPALGSESALVTVIEWCNATSPDCRGLGALRSALLAEFGEDLRWVHRDYINIYDPTEMAIAEFGKAVHSVAGKYWESLAALQEATKNTVATPEILKQVADQLGLDTKTIFLTMEHHGHRGQVGADMIFAGKMGFRSAPSFMINGRLLAGLEADARADALRATIVAELATAKQLVKQGTAPKDVYDALTKDGLWSLDDDPATRVSQDALTSTAR